MMNGNPRGLCVAAWALGLVGVFTSIGSARASAVDGGATRSLSPHFVLEQGDPAIDRMPLERTSVRFAISGVIAEVTVKQTYKNEGTRPISARYVFPASTRAAVHGMRMTVGNRIIEAEIRERQAARANYEAARRAGKTASLLEQQRPNVFSMRVSNVVPGDRIDVELRYTEMLVPTAGEYEFVYPTVVGPRYADGDTEAPQQRWENAPYTDEREAAAYVFELEGRLETGVPVQALSVPSHRVVTDQKDLDLVTLALDPDERDGGDRDFVLRYRLAGAEVESGLVLYEGERENFFLLTVQPPASPRPEVMPPREYVFVLDVSGSMHGFPLDVAKGLLRDLARNLREQDSFNVLLFSGDSRVLWPSARPATPANVERALYVIDEQNGGGGTELLSALKSALSMPSAPGTARSFVVVTDGYISAERDTFSWVRSHLGYANVFAFGIGSSVNRYLIEGLAKAGLGDAYVITDASEATAVATRFREYIDGPVLTDIRVAPEGFDVYDVQPPAVPDLMAERPIVVHGKWRGPAKGALVVTGTSGAGRYEQTVDVAKVRPEPDNGALTHLWARTRIAAVSDFSFGHPTSEERELVTELGLRYGLLTEYTSFVAVAHLVRAPGGDAQEVDQPLPLPLGVSNAAAGEPIYGAPEPELWTLLMLAALLCVRLVRRYRSLEAR